MTIEVPKDLGILPLSVITKIAKLDSMIEILSRIAIRIGSKVTEGHLLNLCVKTLQEVRDDIEREAK